MSPTCRYCGRDHTDNDTVHPECSAEWWDRYNNGMCVTCGNARRVNSGSRCENCDQSSEYVGYDGLVLS